MQTCILWLAQGLGLGRIPWAPGTFGSLGGLLWFLLLLKPGNLWFFIGATCAGIGLSVWISSQAEKILNLRDPSSVVIDEIVAIPICFLPWVIGVWIGEKSFPEPEYFLTGNNWIPTAVIFVLFRVFDILKPWPVGPSQKLKGGWGVTVDDVLAALYVALISLILVVA